MRKNIEDEENLLGTGFMDLQQKKNKISFW